MEPIKKKSHIVAEIVRQAKHSKGVYRFSMQAVASALNLTIADIMSELDQLKVFVVNASLCTKILTVNL
mgnify:CR=1 FL=1